MMFVTFPYSNEVLQMRLDAAHEVRVNVTLGTE